MVEKQEIHIYHHYPHVVLPNGAITAPPPTRYPGVWHGILPPPIVDANGYYEPKTGTWTTRGSGIRYDTI